MVGLLSRCLIGQCSAISFLRSIVNLKRLVNFACAALNFRPVCFFAHLPLEGLAVQSLFYWALWGKTDDLVLNILAFFMLTLDPTLQIIFN